MATGILTPNAESTRLLEGVDWDTYVRLNDDVTSPSVRMAYYRGALEIMTISIEHEGVNRLLADLFTSLAVGFDLDFWNAGSTTHRNRSEGVGFEPDTCFYVSNLDRLPRNRPIELPADPAPDLVIEVDISNSSLNKLPAYAHAGCRECWQHEVGSLTIFVLQLDGTAQRATQSAVLPGVTTADLNRLLEQGATMRRAPWIMMLIEWARARRAGISS